MKECEIWKDVKDYEGLYQVSNLGRVKSLGNDKTRKEKILKLKNVRGYLLIKLCKDGKQKFFAVHRLVAQHFIPNSLNLPEINHKDENKENNCLENLEWCDRTYNINYGTRNERVAEKRSKNVYQYDISGNFIREWKSAYEIQREIGCSQGNISDCCRGKRKSVYKFIWTYEKREE